MGKTMARNSIIAMFRMWAGLLVLFALAASHAQAQILTTLCSFSGSNGEYPCAGVALAGSTLYGTTNGGGLNDGTVFSIATSGGSPATLYSFNYPNGTNPYGNLTLNGSTLYGTTEYGATGNCGTVFCIPTSGGSLTTLFAFGQYQEDESYSPVAGVAFANSTLYGTTKSGYGNAGGTVFSVPASGGSLTTLCSFTGSNGWIPYAGLTLNANGSTLYGTTGYGGVNDDGTVFSIATSGGGLTTLCSFDGSDGSAPMAGLTLVGSTLYGTTYYGGTYGPGYGANGYGTVFSIATSGGSPTTLCAFSGFNGGFPQAGLTLIGSTLYGTTRAGGPNGYGTVFSLPLSGGTPKVLASFNSSNGAYPQAGLTLVGSTLYGTTFSGGANGYGTVFALSLNNYYAWNVAGSGSWATAANWTPAGPPDGADNTADFSQQTLAANAIVTLDGNHTIGNLIFGDAGNTHNWTLAAGSGGTLTLQVSLGTPTITVNNQTTTIAAVLSGSQGLAKFGPDRLVLTASNIYSGPTTINQGNLDVDGWLTNSAVTVDSGGILSGMGSLTSVMVSSGGTLSPGDFQGILHLSGDLILAAGAEMDYSLDGDPTDDEVSMPSSVLSLNAQQFSNFTFVPLAGFAPGSYTLIDAGSVSGVLGSNLSGTIGSYPATLAVKGSDLVLNIVPEPSTAALFGAGVLGLMGWAWRRRLRRVKNHALEERTDV